MKYILFFVFILLLALIVFSPSLCHSDIFKSDFRKGIEAMTHEDLLNFCEEQNKEFIAFKKKAKKDYLIIHKGYMKYHTAYKEITKRPIVLHNVHFSMSAGLSAILEPENLLKSNIDLFIQGSFYYRYLKYSVAFQPVNKNIIISVGVFF